MDNNFKNVRTPSVPDGRSSQESASIGFGQVVKPVIPTAGTSATSRPVGYAQSIASSPYPSTATEPTAVLSQPNTAQASVVIPQVAPSQVSLPTTRTTVSQPIIDTETPPLSSALNESSHPEPVQPQHHINWQRPLKISGLVMAALVLLIGGGYVISSTFFNKQPTTTSSVASNFSNVHLPLTDVVDNQGLSLLGTRSLVINGPLRANDGFTISPSGQPSNATPGQIYFDGSTNQLAYFDGSQFIALGGGVSSVGSLSGEIAVGSGLSAAGSQIVNTGVLSLQGQTGNVSLTAGAGIDITGTTITNLGVISAVAGTPNIQVTDDGAGNITISSVGGGTGTVISPGGTAGRIAKFTGVQTIEDSLIAESGTTITVNGDLSVTGSLTLGSALSVGNGGTGNTSLTNNGVLVGQGSGAITAVTSAAPGLCFVSTAGAPAFAACSGGSTVTSLNGLTGALTIANATGAGSTITINDASTAQKGIAQFNATNFTAAAGVINTIQNINTGASPQFVGLTLTGDLAVNGGDITSSGALNITPSGALTAGAVGQTSLLQGTTATITSNGAGNDVVINSADTIELQDNTNVTGALDVSGALTSGTANAFQVATNGNITTVGDATVQGGLITIGTTSQNGTLALSDGSSNTGTIQTTALGADRIYTLPDATGTICLSTGNCAGAGVTLQSAYNNSTSPEITLDSTRGALTLRDNATPLGANLFEVQNNAGSTTYLAVTATGISVTGTATATGNINSSGGSLQTNGTTRVDNSGNLANIGNISLSGSISGGTTISSSGNINTTGGSLQTNSTTRVDNGGNLTNIGNLSLSGAISGGTTYSGSGNINTTSGVLQTNSVTRVDNTGNLLNIGNITATGAITVASTGAGNDIILNSADTIELQDNTNITGNLDVSGTLTAGTTNAFQVTAGGDVTSAGNATLQGGTVTIGTTSQSGSLVLSDGSSNTGSILTAALASNRTYTLPDASGTICLDTGNCGGAGVTLQSAYNNSTNPEIVVDATRGALTVRDNSTPLGGNLLEVQSNDGSVTYFGVTASGVSVAGTATVSSNINTSGGGIQTGGTTRLDNSGNLTNIVNLGLSGTISGGTTITGSGNFNSTGGSLQTNSITRVDNSGNLTNIGNITGTGAVTIASSGAGNDVIINGADEFIVQDAAVFNGLGTFNTDVDLALTDTENLSITNTVTGTNAVNLVAAVLTNNTTSGSQNIALLQNAAGSGTTDGLLVLDNADTDTAVTSGLLVSSAAGGVTTALDVSDSDIVTALLFGANDITGTNFSVTGSNGDFTSAGNGTLQGGIITVGTTSQAGSLVVSDGSSNTGTIQVAALGSNRVYTFPDATGTVCLSIGNCAGASVTLQSAYDSSTSPEIVLDATRGALTLRDNATPLGANLFEVQSNSGATTYLAVDATGLSVTGTATVTGNINSSSGGIQTGSTTRIDNSGNLTNIGSLTLSGAISGGTTVTGSGNFNTTGGSLQTNSVTRIDNSGNLVNIGNLTATGPLTISSTGATNDIILNSADTIELQDNTNVTGDLDVSGTLTSGTTNAFQVAAGGDVTSAGNATLQGGTVTIGTTSQSGLLALSDGSSNTGSLVTVALGSNRTYTFPDATGVICLDTGNCGSAGVTLQGAYDNSTDPEIVVDTTRGALTVRDNATPIAARLLEVQGNDGSVTYFGVTASGITVSGTATVTGNINTSGGALQTGGTTRVDNSGNLANIGSLTLSGAISGGTTITGSGNFNTTGGSLQTNSITRVDNSGNLTNIGNITGTGAITIASSGAGNDVIINGADEFIIQDAAVFNAQATFNTDVDLALADTENLNITNTVTGTNAVNLISAILTNNSTSGTQNIALLQNAAGSGTTDGLLVLDNADADTAVTSGLMVSSAAGGVTTALDVSDSDIVTALLFGTNDLTGTNFSVTGATGDFLSAGNGTLQGGTINIGTSSQAGSLVVSDGSSNTGTIQVAALGSNRVYTFPDATGTVCLSTGNCAGAGVTLQSAYNNSTSPEIVLDATRGALTLRDNATPIGANLFEVQNNAGGSTYFAVDASGINVTGNADVSGTLTSGTGDAFQVDASGNITTSGTYNTNTLTNTTLQFGGASTATLQSASSQALTITANAASTWSTSTGDLTLQGAASLNVKAVSGNVNIGTNDTTGTLLVLDIKTNAGDPTGTDGAIYYNSNIGSFRCYQGAWTNCITASGGFVSLQNAYDNGNTITTDSSGDIAFTLDARNFTVTTAAGDTGGTIISLADGANTTPPDQLLLVSNNDTDDLLPAAITVTSAAGGITNAIDATDTDIVNALAFGDNDITGTNFGITGATGDFLSAGSGTIQGGTVTVGTTSQAGVLVLSDGSSNTGTFQTATLASNRVYTFPDATGTVCLSTGNCAGAGVTLQTAYNNSTNPEVVVDATRGALTVRDNATPIGANLFEVQNNAGSTTYLGVDASGIAITGTVDASATLTVGTGDAFQVDANGNVTTSGTYNTNTFTSSSLIFGAASTASIQSASSQALTITADAASTWSTSTGDLTLQAAGGLNLKATTGNVVLGTNDTTGTLLVLDIKTNAGDPTGTDGAIYYNSNIGSFRCYQGAWTNCITASGGFVSLQNAYDNGNTITTDSSGDIGFTLNAQNFTITTAATASGSTTFSLADGSNATPPAQLVLINNADTDETLDAGLTVTSGSGGITTALDASGSNITNALDIGGNAIAGTNFNVTAGGAVTAVGVDAGTGLLQGIGGATLSGATINLNNNSNFATNINTGSSTGTVTIGGGNAPLIIDSTNFDVTSAGAVSGVTTLNTSGVITVGALGANTGAASICRNSSSQISTCSGAGGIDAAVTLQNAYANGNTIATTDARDISLTLVDTATDGNFTITTATNSTGFASFLRADGAGTADPAQLVLVKNNDIDRVQPIGISVQAAAGGVTTAFDASGANITNALAIGAHAITGTNFSVTGGGAVTAVGVNAGVGLLQGALGLTVSGATASLNNNSNFATNINTGSSTGTVTIGGGNAPIVIDSTNFDVTSAGAVSGVTTINTSGNITSGGDVAVNGGDLTSTGALNITPGGSLTIGATSEALTLQGNASTTLTATDSGNTTSLIFQTPTADVNYRLATAAAGTYDICTSVGNCSGTGSSNTLQAAYDAGNTILTTDARNIAFTLANTATDPNFTISTATGSTGFTSITRADGAGTADPAQLLLVKNNDVDRILPIGVSVQSAGGGITTAYDASGSNITNALAIGANAISGTNFSVTGGGAVTAVGVDSGTGLIQGTGGLTISGAAISLNNNSNFATNINTGSSIGTVTIGGGSAPLVINSTNFDVTSAGAVSGVTTLDTSGNITGGGDVAVNGGDITSTGALNITPTGTLTAGSTNQTLTLQGDASTTLSATDSGNTTTLSFVTPISDVTYRLTTASAGTYNICTTAGNCFGSGSGNNLQAAYDAGNTIATTDARDISFTLANTTTDSNFTIATATGSTGFTSITRSDGAGSADPAQLLLIKNNDTDRVLPVGISVQAAAGGLTTAIDVSGANITNALSIGANAIAGTNFSVTGGGAVTAVGVDSGTGLIQGTGGATLSGATINLNNNSNFATNINTGSSTGTITLGGGSAPLVIDSTNFDVTSAGAVSGVTTLNTSGIITVGGLGANTGAASICRNSSNQLSSCSGSGGIDAAVTLQNAYANGNTIATTDGRDVSVTLADTTTDANFAIGIATGSTGFASIIRADGAGTADPAQMFLVKNNDTDRVQPIGISVQSATGGITTAFDASGSNITNALAIGAHAITGTNFSVAANGAVTAVGVNSGTGLIQGTGGLTISGAAISLNNNSNFAASINTGSSTGTITLGGGSAPLVIDSTNFDVSSAGALSGITTINTSGNITDGGDLAVNGGDITSTGALNITPTGTLTAGSTGQALTLQGNASTTLSATNGSDTTTLSFQSPTAAVTYRLATAAAGTYDICTTVGNCSGSGSSNTLQAAYDAGNTILTTDGRDIAFTLANTSTDPNFTISTATGSTGFTSITRADGAGTADPAQLVLVKNNDTDRVLPIAVSVQSAGGGVTTAFDASGSNITNALAIGAHAITGTNFSVTGGGAVTAVGVDSGTGLIQGTGGLTVSGATTNINNNSNFATNINTGSSTGTVTIGGGSAPLVIDSTNFDVTSAGAVSGVTTLNTSGVITVGSLGANTGSSSICRNSSSQISTCSGSGGIDAAVTLQNAYANGNTIATTDGRDISLTLSDNTTDGNFTITTATNSTGFTSFLRADGAGTADPAQLVLVKNNDIDRVQPIGVSVQAAAGGVTTAFDASGSNITNALAIGANAITGTNFSVTGGGAVTAVGVNAGAGLLQGALGLTISGATASINNNSNFATNINTGSSTGTITLGGGSSPLVIDSTNFDVTSAGAVSGVTTLNTSGNITGGGDIAVNGGDVTSTGTLNITPTGTLTAGSIGQTLTLQGNGSTSLSADDSGNTTALIFQTPTADVNYRLATAAAGTYDICTTVGNCTGTAATLQSAYDTGNTILTTDARDISFTLANTTTDPNFTISTATGSTGFTSIIRADGAGTADPAQLVLVKNNDTDRVLPIGVSVQSAAGGVTTAFDASGSNITNALAIGLNAITGTNFSVAANGAVTAVGVNSGTGLIQGTGGLTLTTNGITLSGVTTDITTASNEALTLSPAGNGDLVVATDNDTNFVFSGTVTSTNSQDLATATLTNQTSSGTQRGLALINADDAANASTESLIFIDNAETNASTLTDGILITSSGVNNGIVDAIDVSDSNITNGINLGTNLLVASGDSINDFTGNGALALSGNALTVDATVSGDNLSSTTLSGSGLEVLATGVSLLAGCSDSEILKWNETSDTWGCSSDAGSSTISFSTITPPSGSSPVADGANDTLNLTVTGTNLTITGTSGTDTIDFDISETALAGNGLGASGSALQVNTGGTLEISGDNVQVNLNSGFAWTATHNFAFNGTENMTITSDLNNSVNIVAVVGTPSSTAGTTRGIFIQQAASAFSNGLDNALVIDNNDADLAIGSAIQITNSGAGVGFTNFIDTPSSVFKVDGSGNTTVADLICSSASCISTSEITDGTITGDDVNSNIAGLGLTKNTATTPDSLDVDLLGVQDGSGSTFSFSGLEFQGASSDTLALLQGCSDNQVLKWDDETGGNGRWDCAADSTGGSLTVRESDGSPSVSPTTTLEFGPAVTSSEEFIVTDQTGGVARIAIGTQVGKLNEAESVTGGWTFGTGTTTFNSTSTFNTDVDLVFAATENLTITNTTGSNAVDLLSLTLTNNDAGSAAQRGLAITNADSTSTTEALIALDNADTTASSLTDGIIITSSGANGGVVDAIDVSAANITNAINIGANDILSNGTTISSAELNLLDSHDAALVDINDAVSTAIIGTGALDSGSITANFGAIDTGADNITTTGIVNANDFTRSSSGALTFGNTNATSVSICNSAACDTIDIGINTDADTITIGDSTDALALNAPTTLGSTAAFNGVATFNTDADFILAGTENVSVTHDLAGTINVFAITGTPNSSSNTANGLYIDQVNSANGNGFDSAIVINNSDTNLAIGNGILFSSGGGGFTNFIDTPSSVFKVDGTGNTTVADLICSSASCISTGEITDGTITGDDVNSNIAGLGILKNTSTTPDSLDIDLLDSVDGTSGITSSNSGLEFQGASSDELTLLQGCGNNEILKWNDGSSIWACGTDNNTGGSITLQTAYDNDTDNNVSATLTLSTNDDGIIITNPTSGGTDSSAYTIQINQANTTAAVSAIDIIQASNASNAVNLTANSIDGETALAISATALTTGFGIDVTTGTGTTSGGGIRVSGSGSSAIANGLVQITHSGAYTSTGGLLNVTSSASTAGTLVNFTNNTASFTGTTVNVSATGTTTGTTLNVAPGNGVTSGAAIKVTAAGTSAIANGLVQVSHTGAYTSTGGLLNVSATASTAGTLVNFANNTASFTGSAVSISNSGATTGFGLDVTAGSTITSGAGVRVSGSGTSAIANGMVQLTHSGNYTSTGGLLNVTSSASTAGTLVNFTNNTASYTGSAVSISNSGATTGFGLDVTAGSTITSGAGLRVSGSGTSAIANGMVQITHSGNYTSTGGLLNVTSSASTAGTLVSLVNNTASFTGTALAVTTNGQTSGTGVNISSTATGQTGNSLIVTSASTSAAANGLVRFNFSGAHTGNGFQIDDATVTGTALAISDTAVMTTTGSLLTLTANNATTATGLLTINGTGITTGSAVTINGNTGSSLTSTGNTLNVSGGRVSFTPTQTVASGAAAVWNGINLAATTATLTGTTQVDTATGFNFVNVARPTLTDGSAVTVINSATMYIANAPLAAGSVSITNPYALWVDDGNTRFDGTSMLLGENSAHDITVMTRAGNAAGQALTISAGTAGAGASAFVGGDLTLAAGDAAGTGNEAGGDILLLAGDDIGNSEAGRVIVRAGTGNESVQPFFSVQQNDSGSIFGVSIADGGANSMGIQMFGVPENVSHMLTFANDAFADSCADCNITIGSDTSGATEGDGMGIQIIGGNTTDTNADGGNIILTGGDANGIGVNGAVIVENVTDSTIGFRVRQTDDDPILTVDTTNGEVELGKAGASGITGKLVFYNATDSDTTTIQGSTSATASYTLTLPTALPGSTQCITVDTGGLMAYGACSGGSSPFTSTAGVITKTTGTDQLDLIFDNAALGEYQLKIANSTTAVTGDAMIIDLTGGTGIITDTVDGLYIHTEAADGPNNAVSGLHVDFDSLSGTSGDVFSGILIDSITAQNATEYGINIGSGWDQAILANGKVTIGTATAGTEQLRVIGANGGSGAAGTDGLYVDSGDGGVSSSANGGVGGAITLITGTGGNYTGSSSFVGGDGGAFAVTAQNGGTNSSSNSLSSGGNGGTISLDAGDGGASNAALTFAGVGGSIAITAGNGGTSTSGGGGAGGDVTITAGTAADGGASDGITGNVYLQPGINAVGSGLGGKVQIGSSTANDDVNLLVLDSYNNGTNPTPGTAGAMYFNTSDNTFRCFTTAWGSCGGASSTPNFDDVYGESVSDGNLNMEISNASGLNFDLTSSGNFAIRDGTTAIATYFNTGGIDFTPTVDEDVRFTFTGNSTFNVNPRTYVDGVGAINIARSTAMAGTSSHIASELAIAPSLTMTEPSSGLFTWIGSYINMTGITVTGAAGDSTIEGLRVTMLPGTNATNIKGINIPTVTASGAAQTALEIGSGWDTGISIQSSTGANFLLITDTSTTAADVLTIADGGITTFKSQTNNAAAFVVKTSADAAIFTVDTSNSRVIIGTTTNGMTFDPASGPLYNGTGRPTKRISLTPEFAGGTMTAGSGSNNTGTMTSDNENASPYHNFYKWTATSGTAQTYDIFVKVPLPMDFAAWCSSANCNPTIFLYTKNSASDAASVKIATYDTAAASVQALTNIASANTSWNENSVNATASAQTWTAGGYMTLDIRVSSISSSTVQVGELRMDYLSKF